VAKKLKVNMIKTLRVTSVVAVVLAVVFFVFPVVFGVRSDEQVEEFLNSPGVIAKFNKARGDKDKRSESQISPLVKESQAFALYLNPPTKPKQQAQPIRKATTTPRPQGPVSPKFKLMGTSYYASRPELSLALIDEPGKGSRWVRQSSEVSHLIIEQVKDGLVVIRDGKRTFELVPERPKERSLLQGASFGGTGSRTSSTAPAKAGVGIRSDKAPQQPSAEEKIALLKKSISELKAMKTGVESGESSHQDNTEEPDMLTEMLISDLEAEAMRISDEEAERLGDLGKELNGEPNDIQQDPNQAKDRKVERSKRRREPNSPNEK